MKIHFIYVCIVIFINLIGLFILGPGSVLTFTFLIGIVTIPLAILIATIPMIGLVLLFSLPFYFLLTFKWPTRSFINIAGSIFLGFLLSAGIAAAARSHLLNSTQDLTTQDFSHTIDFSDKHVALANAGSTQSCGRLCEELIFLGGAKSVTLTSKTIQKEKTDVRTGTTFGLSPIEESDCKKIASRNISREIRQTYIGKMECLAIVEHPTASLQLEINANAKLASYEQKGLGNFNPFQKVMQAERFLIHDLTAHNPEKKFQYTTVTVFPPFWVIWPISISKGLHTPQNRGLFRLPVEVKGKADFAELLFRDDQR